MSTSSIAMSAVGRAQIDAFIERSVDEALAVALVKGDILIDHGPDALQLNPHAKPLIANELGWLVKQPPSLPRKGAQEAGGFGQTKAIALQALGVLRSFNLGARVQVSARDVTRYRLAQILLSCPIDGPKLKIRQPAARFRKKVRPRTPAELLGLKRGNEQRAEEARKRREAARF